MAERWGLLDDKGNPTGKTMLRGERLRPGQYHLVVHIWIVDSSGRMLIQRRAENLKLMPGVWAVTGGSALAGEEGEAAARRELREELGVDTAPGELQHLGRLRRRNSFCSLWLLSRDMEIGELRLQTEEVADAAWVSWKQLMEMVRSREFHHYGDLYFEYIYKRIYNKATEESD